MLWIRLLPWAGWGVAALMLGMYMNARDAVIEERESCNTDKAMAVVEAERVTREALSEAHQRAIEQIGSLLQAERSALRAAREGLVTARADASQANAIIKRLKQAAEESENASIEQICLLTDVPSDITDSLRQ